MDIDLYKGHRQKLGQQTRKFAGWIHLGVFFALTGLGIYFSLSKNPFIFILGEIIFILSLINGQVLVHELGHGFFLGNKKLTHFFGHIVALSPIIPYKPWVLIHSLHHRWSGNKHKDPTMVDKKYEDLKPSEIKIINFCWKYWIPIFSLSYSLRSFWNLKKLDRLFPEHKGEILLSQFLQIALYGTLFYLFPEFMLKSWLPAYVIFLAVSEPLLFSQHVHIDQGDARFEDFTPESSYHVKDQDIFCRNLIFPKWFTHWILLGFNQHAIHHVFPNLPGFEYHRVKENFPNTVPWRQWYAFSKSVDAATLLFRTNKDTQLIKDHQ